MSVVELPCRKCGHVWKWSLDKKDTPYCPEGHGCSATERKDVMSKYQTTILQVAIHREEENPIFGEGNTYVKVEDDAGGPFIVIQQDESQFHQKGVNTLRFDYEELQAIQEAAKMLMHQMYIERAAL